jgi:hypothetical protein
MLETRCSEIIQNQLLERLQGKYLISHRKRAMEGITLSSHNSFAVLDNECIASIAIDMGIQIPECNFDSIDLMKDLEVARHVIDKAQNINKM